MRRLIERSSPWRRRRLVSVLLMAGAAVLVAALVVFEPWKLVIDQRVNDPPPQASDSASLDNQRTAPVTVARGRLISHEHASSGTVTVIRLADNSRVLRLEGLHTSNGPALRVWLAAAPVGESRNGWYVFDDDRHVDLGPLKGNIGSSNYPLPPDLDLAALPSVSIWCDRFNVSFAAAALTPE
jgi:hypothetical protein